MEGCEVVILADDHGQGVFSINVAVGLEDELYAEGGRMYPDAPLNEDSSRKKTEEGHE